MEHRGLRPDPCDYAYVEVDDGTGWTPSPARRQGRRGQRHRRRDQAPGAGEFDLSALRGQEDRPPLPLQDRRRRAGQTALPAASSSTTSAHRRRPDAVQRRRRGRRHGWTARRLLARRRLLHRRLPDSYYIARNRQYVSYDKSLKAGPYNFGLTTPSRAGWSTSRTRRRADLAVGHLAARQQGRPAPRSGLIADGRAPRRCPDQAVARSRMQMSARRCRCRSAGRALLLRVDSRTSDIQAVRLVTTLTTASYWYSAIPQPGSSSRTPVCRSR